MQRASFISSDPTLRLMLKVSGIASVPHPQLWMHDVNTLYVEDDTPFGTCVGAFTSAQLWKLITERKAGQSIAELLLGRVAGAEAQS